MRIISYFKIAKSVRRFNISQKYVMNKPWASGGILLLCVIIAMLLANLPFTKEIYQHVLETELLITIQSPLHEGGTRVIDWAFPNGMNVERFSWWYSSSQSVWKLNAKLSVESCQM